MVFKKLRVSQNCSQISQVSQSRFSSAVLYASQSRFFRKAVLESRSKNSKRLWLAEKNASLAGSQSLEFTIRHLH